MPKVPDDLPSSIVFCQSLPDLTRQLENIIETLADAHNTSINSQEQQFQISTTPSTIQLGQRGIGILFLLATQNGHPSLIAACCKPTVTSAATIQTLCSQSSADNQSYSVQWPASGLMKVSASGGNPHPVRLLWIGFPGEDAHFLAPK